MDLARLSRPFLRFAAICLMVVTALVARPALAAIDYTDIWWDPAEPGWGVNLVQSDNFIFATFFIYASTNKPTWYSAQLTRDSNGIWSGPIYTSSGTYFGAPFNATHRDIDQVGNAAFAPNSDATGAISYNVDSVIVTKTIERQTLQRIDIAGNYAGALITDVYNCDNGIPVVTRQRFVDASASLAVGGALQLNFSFQGGGTCSFTGNATQYGHLYHVDNASYTCGVGLAKLSELKSTAQGLEGRWTAPSAGGCTEFGKFSVVLK